MISDLRSADLSLISYGHRLFICTIAASCSFATHANAEEPPNVDVQAALSAYARSSKRLQERQAYKAQADVTYKGNFDFTKQMKRVTASLEVFRSDKLLDLRIVGRLYREGNLTEPVHERFLREIVTQDNSFAYRTGIDESPGRVRANRNVDKYSKRAENLLFGSPYLDGVDSDSKNPFADLMTTAAQVTAQPEPETVDGHKTVVLRANTSQGAVTVWLDPEMGHAARKITVDRSPTDNLGDIPLSDVSMHRGDKTTVDVNPDAAPSSHHVEVHVSEFKQVGDIFVPMKAVATTSLRFSNGQTLETETQLTRFTVDLEPDFKAAKAFEPDFPDGTAIMFSDDRRTDGIPYEWRHGAIVPQIQRHVVASIEHQIDDLRPNAQYASEPPAQSSGSTLPVTATGEPIRTSEPRWALPWILLAAGGLLVVACPLCWILFRRQK